MQELKVYHSNEWHNEYTDFYLKSEADKVIAEKEREIALLKERICNGDVSRLTWIDDCFDKDNEIKELKAKLENVQASMYADVVDANMENRRLKRALWLARAEIARTSAWVFWNRKDDYNYNKWKKVERKCRAKAKEYL